jgi:hypothetical protein
MLAPGKLFSMKKIPIQFDYKGKYYEGILVKYLEQVRTMAFNDW